MQKSIWFCLLVLLPLSAAFCQNNCGLARQIQVELRADPLGVILQKLRTQYDLPLSYSDNRLPAEKPIEAISFDGILENLLQNILAGTDVKIRCLSGQILLYLPASNAKKKDPADSARKLTQIIRGQIVDRDSRQAIPYATVFVQDIEPIIGANTDEDGRFRLRNVPVGRHDVVIRHINYEPQRLRSLLLGSGKEIVLKIEMVQKISQAEEVIITNAEARREPLNPLNTISTHRFSVEESKRYAATVGDPARMAQVLPGVVGGDDLRNELSISGNNPRGVLWQLEGLEIPNPNHFAREGTSSGSISLLSANVLGDSEFLTGAFPAQYGNALSGVFDLRLREGNDSVREHSFQIGLLGIEASTEGPFNKKKEGPKASYLVNYRNSSLEVFEKIVLNDTNLVREDFTNYRDFAYKLHFPFKKGAVDIWGISGFSDFGLGLKGFSGQKLQNEMGLLGGRFRRTLGDDSYLSVSLAGGASRVQFQEGLLNGSELLLSQDTEQRFLLFNILWHKKYSSRLSAEYGYFANSTNFRFEGSFRNQFLPSPLDNWQLFDSAGNLRSAKLYANFKYRLNEETDIVAGVHLLSHGLLNQGAFEPRLAARFRVAPGQLVTIGMGIHSRRESLEYHLLNNPFTDDRLNPNLGLTRAIHLVMGYEWRPSADVLFKAEAYQQTILDVPVVPDDSISGYLSTINEVDGYLLQFLTNSGAGVNTGLELMLHKQLANQYYFLVTGSIYQSNYNAGDGFIRNTRFNTGYQSALVAGKEFLIGKKQQKRLGIHTKMLLHGNRRYTPIDLAASVAAGEEVRDWVNQAYTAQYPDYFRLDLQLSFRGNRRKHTNEWRIDLQNITRRKNVLRFNYDVNAEEIRPDFHFSLLPMMSYRIEF
ncbi:MAG: TonB-dependent receptor [Bacteroidota bacterium]